MLEATLDPASNGNSVQQVMVCFRCLPDIFSIDGTDDNGFPYQPLISQMASTRMG